MKRLWKIIKGLVAAAAALFVLSLAAVIFVGLHQPAIPQKADAIIVLGAAINTPELYNRSLQGLKLYEEGKGKVLILSGGRISDKDISEAQYMQKVIMANTSSTPPMILEQNSHSTYDNIENSKQLDPEAHSVVIVSDTYHLARGAAMARAAGFSPVYWSSPNTTSYYSPGQLAFYYFREAVAMIAYIPKFITGR